MSSKDEYIEHLEAEILAARKTIMALTRAIEEVSKRSTVINTYPKYVQPYVQPYTYPTWTYTYGTGTTTSGVGGSGGGSFTNIAQINKKDDGGDEGDRAAV